MLRRRTDDAKAKRKYVNRKTHNSTAGTMWSTMTNPPVAGASPVAPAATAGSHPNTTAATASPAMPLRQIIDGAVSGSASGDNDDNDPATFDTVGRQLVKTMSSDGGGDDDDGGDSDAVRISGSIKPYTTLGSSSGGGNSYDDTAASDSLSNTLSSFEEIMRERNRIRREREEYHVAELKVQIHHLEAALAAETKRRVDATTKLDEKCRTMVYDMETRLKQQIDNDNKYINDRMKAIESRLSQLEKRFESESHSHMEYVQHKADDFQSTLLQIQREQDTERKSRIQRERRLLQQVETSANELQDLYMSERADRQNEITKLSRQIEEQRTSKTKQEEDYTSKVNAALEQLQKEMSTEIAERQQNDDEIANALNRYIQQLQYSLSILSSD